MTISCPPIGLTTRPAANRRMLVGTALRGSKVPYAHMSGTFALPEWLGGAAKAESIGGFGRGDLKARYARTGGDAPGDFRTTSRSVQSPGASTLSLTVKEQVGETLYLWSTDKDIDVRTQSCGRVDDANNWDMIKRLCNCIITDMDTSGETATDPNDEGETMIKASLKSGNEPVIILPVNAKLIDLYAEVRFAQYPYAPVVAGWPGCGFVMPVTDESFYNTYMAAYGTDVSNLTSGTALLPYPPVSISGNDNIVVAVLSDGSVYWSADSGKTFYLSTGVIDGLVVQVLNYSNILVGGSGGIYSDSDMFQSTDGGRTFKEVDPFNAVTGNVVAIAYHDNNVVYVLDSNSNLSVSDDGGETFIRTSTTEVDNPTAMVEMGGMVLVGGYIGSVPVIIGSEDGGYTWYVLARFPGNDDFSVGFTPKVRLASCGCGVVEASVVWGDDLALHSEVYRNVNWGATGCWERIWEDSVQAAAYNGLMMITDLACSCVNDIMAVGMILGDEPLYFGLRFSPA